MNENRMLREVFDALPSMVFVVDRDVRIQEYNAAAAELITAERAIVLQQRAGDILRCINASKMPGGCGCSSACKVCIIRNSVTEAFRGNRAVRRRTRIQLVQHGEKIEIYALVTVSPFSFQGNPHALLVIEDLNEIAELYNIIFICPICGKMQDQKDSWMRVEAYFKNNWDIDCSHGYCPDCFKLEMEKVKAYDRSRSGNSR
ncbi:MAG: PAS domain-containing protein [Candidatus Electrothrix sp. YB6]